MNIMTIRRGMGTRKAVYEEYDYLESTGSGGGWPYINTMLIPYLDSVVDTGIKTNLTNVWIHGCRDAGQTNRFAFLYDAQNKVRVDRNSTYPTFNAPVYNIKATFEINERIIKCNNVQIGNYSQLSVRPSYPIFLFANNNAGAVQINQNTYGNSMRMYFTLFAHGGQIDRSFSPCKLLHDTDETWDGNMHYAGECGMWDNVHGIFYGNANNAGTFIVGNE